MINNLIQITSKINLTLLTFTDIIIRKFKNKISILNLIFETAKVTNKLASCMIKKNKTIYKLFNEVHKTTYKKHNIICQISNQLFLLLMNIRNRQSSLQSKKNTKT